MAKDEEVALYDDDGKVVGSAPRSLMRARNLRHAASSVIVRDGIGRIYLHRRTTTKDVYPGLLDFAAGGVVKAGEDPAVGAVREAEEELGVTGASFEPLEVEDYADDATRYRAFRYVVTYDGPIRWQAEEVSWGEWVTVEELVRRLDDEVDTIVPDSVSVWGETVRGWAADRTELQDDSDGMATLLEGRWIERVSRTERAAARLMGESLLLGRIADSLPLEVPRPVVIEGDPLRVRHLLVRGEPAVAAMLSRDDGLSLGAFLRAVHMVDLRLLTDTSVPTAHDDVDDRTRRVEVFRRQVLPRIPSGLAGAGRDLLGRVAHVGDQTLCHAGLSAEHVLVLPGKLNGVIAWGDSRVTDPARDLAWALHGTTARFADGVAEGYAADDATLARARHWWALDPWYDVLRTLSNDDETDRDGSLQGLLARLDWWAGER
jgi:8-oxo-dGTP pyrophosphatase MutT (NUDIX family)/aminoglycoside phosphotransferase (APT) family kinase protein